MNAPDSSSSNLLGNFPQIIQALKQSPAVSYVLDSGYHIVYCNPAWDDFAESNGAPQLTGNQIFGLDIFRVIPSVLTNFYCDVYARALREGTSEVSYECSSPDLFRKYRMRVHVWGTPPLFMVTNSLSSASQAGQSRRIKVCPA